MSDSQFNGFEQVHRTFARADDELRQRLVAELVEPNMAYLRHGNTMHGGQEGWYAAFPSPRPKNTAVDREPFPIPTECRSWYASETDLRDGLVYRFFDKRAWLYLAPPSRPGHLEFIIPYVLLNEVLQHLELWVADVRVAWRMAQPDGASRPRVIIDISAPLFSFLQMAERVRLDIACRISGVPRMIHQGSQDTRRMSLAISFPRFVQV